MKKILPVAVLAALLGVNGAQAVHVDSAGLGEVLIHPFYTEATDQDTYIHLVNSADSAKAVMSRIRVATNTYDEPLDFNLYADHAASKAFVLKRG